MDRVQVSSSNIASVGFDGMETLEVEFHSGIVYRYFGVPEEIYEALLNPPGGSVGVFFNANVRNSFPFERQ